MLAFSDKQWSQILDFMVAWIISSSLFHNIVKNLFGHSTYKYTKV